MFNMIDSFLEVYTDLFRIVNLFEVKPKFIKKRNQGIVIYTKPTYEKNKNYKKTFYNRRISSLRILKKRRKEHELRIDFDYSLFSCFN